MYPTGVNPARLLILLAFGVVLGVPFVFRPDSAVRPDGARELIIITPHNEQIRHEFSTAFDAWHRERYDEPAVIEWVTPGGTSEIRKQLESVYRNALVVGKITPGGELADPDDPMPYDMLFGGGSYELGRIKTGVTHVTDAGEEITLPLSVPAPFDDERFREWYGADNRVGPEGNHLYDPDRHWLGYALSGFGIVYNRDSLRKLGLDDPTSWHDLTRPELKGWVALADPRQSGSVATLYDSILTNFGWDEGWRLLRLMSANARYFSNNSKKPPLDVSQGDAAMGVCIDFYGRYQAQAVMREGETAATARVGYVDPPGATLIDPDPISILRGGPDPEVAGRFLLFVMSDEGQALWQLPARGEGAEPGALGPERFELRRMPIRRDFIAARRADFIDDVDPFEIASTTPPRGWRSAVGPMMGAFGIDLHAQLAEAWGAVIEARAAAAGGAFPAETLAEMERLLLAMPDHTLPDGRVVPFDPEHYREVRDDWRDPERRTEARLAYDRFFRGAYAEILRLWRENRGSAA